MLRVHVREKRLHQLRKIFLVFAQGWHMDVKHVEAIVQVVTKFPARDCLLRSFVGGRKDAHIHGSLYLAAEAAQFVVLQNAQKLCLRAHGHFADLVQQEGTAFGKLETSGAAFEGAGESAFFVAKDFTLNQSFRNRRAVDRHEWFGAPRAQFVDGACDHFLAGSAGTGDEHGGGAGRHHFDEPEDFLHFFRGTHELAE